MKHFAGLDVSLEETTLCVVDEAGAMVREARMPSEPEQHRIKWAQDASGRHQLISVRR